MLAIARRKLAALPASVQERLTLVNQDISALNLGRRFGFVCVPFRSFHDEHPVQDWSSGPPLSLLLSAYGIPRRPRLPAMVNLTVASQRFNAEFAAGWQLRPARGTACRRPAAAYP
jgi:hypothetical protein